MTEYAWLIERKHTMQEICEYLTVKHTGFYWTEDHKSAIRFARKEDADNMIDAFGWMGAYPAEHGWDNHESS